MPLETTAQHPLTPKHLGPHGLPLMGAGLERREPNCFSTIRARAFKLAQVQRYGGEVFIAAMFVRYGRIRWALCRQVKQASKLKCFPPSGVGGSGSRLGLEWFYARYDAFKRSATARTGRANLVELQDSAPWRNIGGKAVWCAFASAEQYLVGDYGVSCCTW